MKNQWHAIYKLLFCRSFYSLSQAFIPWLAALSIITLLLGLFYGLVMVPADTIQGDGFRIIFVHVPCAFLSLIIYCLMTVAAFIALIYRKKLAYSFIDASAILGAWFAFLTLASGAIWGKLMWGAWWVWDVRLTSELILFLLYLVIITLRSAIPEQTMAQKTVAVIIIFGFIDIPIIHYSVKWWRTLHQGSTLHLFGKSLIAPTMLYPMLLIFIALMSYYAWLVLLRMRNNLLESKIYNSCSQTNLEKHP